MTYDLMMSENERATVKYQQFWPGLYNNSVLNSVHLRFLRSISACYCIFVTRFAMGAKVISSAKDFYNILR